MVMASGLGLLAIETPLAVQLVKLTVPKLASGKTPPEPEGASAIHSAEPSFARGDFWEVVNVQCFVALVMVSVKFPLPLTFTSAVIASLGATGLERLTGNLGYI